MEERFSRSLTTREEFRKTQVLSATLIVNLVVRVSVAG
jgi:hypothetical protein